MVGSSGSCGQRLSEVTATARKVPARTTGSIEPAFCSAMVTRPPITSVITAPR